MASVAFVYNLLRLLQGFYDSEFFLNCLLLKLTKKYVLSNCPELLPKVSIESTVRSPLNKNTIRRGGHVRLADYRVLLTNYRVLVTNWRYIEDRVISQCATCSLPAILLIAYNHLSVWVSLTFGVWIFLPSRVSQDLVLNFIVLLTKGFY